MKKIEAIEIMIAFCLFISGPIVIGTVIIFLAPINYKIYGLVGLILGVMNIVVCIINPAGDEK